MKVLNKLSGVITIGITLFFIQGCSTFMNFKDCALTIDDIIIMSNEKINPDVIIHRIKKTHTSFKLDLADIIRLKNEGVENKITITKVTITYHNIPIKPNVITNAASKNK